MAASAASLPAQAGPSWAKARLLAMISAGGALEFYDFLLFGLFAGEIARAFFPARDRLASLALTFGVFAAGYIVRPLGGMVLGHFGDRYGRSRVFTLSLLAVSISTAAFGLVPSYAALGLASPLLVLLLRCVQGFCLGGELPVAVTYTVESVSRRAGLACGWLYACVNLGVAVAALLSWAVNAWLAPAQVAAFGWRIPFLIGGAVGLVVLSRRACLAEAPDYLRVKDAARRPVSEVITGHWRAILVGAAAMAAPGAFNALLFTHMTAYLADLGYAPAQVAAAQSAAIAVLAAGLVGSAWLGDLIPRHWVLGAGAALFAAFSYPFYRLLIRHGGDPVLMFALAAGVASLSNGTFACIAAQLFPTRVRLSGLALAINLGFTLFSGVAPLAATWAMAVTGNAAAPGLIMAACGGLSLAASFAVARMGQAPSAPMRLPRQRVATPRPMA